MTGYTRQSAADIVDGEIITAAPLNDEFDTLQDAFSTLGHTHDGTTGNGPKINLTTSVTGILPVANGGTGSATINFVTLATAQTITGLKTISVGTSTANTSFLNILPTDYAAGKPGLFFTKSSTATKWSLDLWDGSANTGTINFSSGTLTHNDIAIVTTTGTQTLTNKTLTSPTINAGALSGTLSGNATFSGALTLTSDSGLVIAPASNASLNLGRTDGVANSAFIDFNTGATAVDFDTRLISTGGTGSNGGGTLTFTGATFAWTSNGNFVGTAATQTLTNKTLTSPVMTGGSWTGGTDLAVDDGGTAASTAAGARTNLGIDSIIDVQIFTADGTWTKPALCKGAHVYVWGAGGSGSSSATCGGGGGGGYNTMFFTNSQLGATETVTVGTGGAAVTNANGNAGGASQFGTVKPALVFAGGGGGGVTGTNGGGGGGMSSSGSGATAGNPKTIAYSATLWQPFGGGEGRTGSNGAGQPAVYGGGGGGGGSGVGGNSIHGGGGGGANANAGGTSIYGGDGGAGLGSASPASSGSVPGGGGGGNSNTGGASGAGANGRVVVISYGT